MATVTKPIIKDETGQEIISAIQDLKDTIMTNDSSLSDPFSTSVSYAVGDYCIYESTLYKCVVAHTGAWNDTHFIAIKAMDEVESINEKIGDVIDEDTTPTTISYTPTITVDNALGVNAEDVKVKIEPVQDLHGYNNPWVGGAGKNLLQVTATSETKNGVTITVNSDGTFKATGTATSVLQIVLNNNAKFPTGSYKFNGAIGNTYAYMNIYDNTTSTNVVDIRTTGDATISLDSSHTYAVRFIVTNGTTVNGTFKPMIRSATETDPTFAPYSNICPIGGHTGVTVARTRKNQILKIITESNISANGVITAGGVYDLAVAYIKKGASYTITTDDPNGFVGGFFADEPNVGSISVSGTRVIQANKTITATENYYIVFRTSTGYATPQIELGSTATPYEPYQGNTYTIDLNGTRYGGTLDVTSGELTLTHEIVDLDTFTFYAYNLENRIYYSPALDTNKTEGIFEQYSIQTPPPSVSTWKDGCAIIESSNHRIYIKDTRYADATAFNAATKGKLVYELATPQTIQLTPTQIKMLQGNNTLFADSGDSQLSYYVNTLGNIGGVLSEIADVTENKAEKSDLTSINIKGTTNSTGSSIASGTYFYLNNVLVKAKADIANGATFTKNTNYEEVTAGGLNALNSELGVLSPITGVLSFIAGNSHSITINGDERTFLVLLGESYIATAVYVASEDTWYTQVISGTVTLSGNGTTLTVTTPYKKTLLVLATNGRLA